MQLTREEQIVHETALKNGGSFVTAEWPLIQIFRMLSAWLRDTFVPYERPSH